MGFDERAAEAGAFPATFFSALLDDSHARVPRLGVPPSHFDAMREPWRETTRTRVLDVVARAAGRLGFSRKRFDAQQAGARLEEVVAQLPGLAKTYELLDDERSKEVLLSVLRFRVLGAGHVALPVSRRRFWQACEAMERDRRIATAVLDTPWDQKVDLYELRGRSGPIRYYGLAQEIVDFFELEQYAYRHGSVRIGAEQGDYVVDGGGGWGETALYFADAVGEEGRVFCLEFVLENVAIIARNLEQNPRLQGRIELLTNPLWRSSGDRLRFEPAGPVTSVVASPGGQTATSVSVDGLRSSRDIPRIDFIKLDVEGAELEVLRGAEETLRSCRPALAIAVYHRIVDMVEIPAFLADHGYELFLDHITAGPYETTLFGRPRA